MPRKKEFDREAVLRLAIAVFCAKGYSGASTDDLLRHMKIGRQSMYDTFGDKRALFLEALQRYNADSIAEFCHHLRGGGASSPLAGLRSALYHYADKSPAHHSRGCMGVNAICELGTQDKEVSHINGASAMVLGAALVNIFAEAKTNGELSTDIDEQGAAAFIGATLVGMKVNGRAGASTSQLRQLVDFAMAGFEKSVRVP
ncbi:TetR/AcrR family transcriptional regulator [Burkholderia sp. PAMC 26561]|uniref:TetR/AcrR family transcriptional regulator n=1 Tax=Burkholderia sp. PAMC 26561 TaxID=1795043 RepID=UPI00076B1AD7|nr:TetR/AcrR family transcriptional regulator [Burkholderia sp. PAMC 26561]AME26988.1 hypothetical protein AXG89_23805 [Burkholderia sp. PAMC 26561]AME27867.2 hypothetical protein AXG89_28885 [Burkholderia sp. PAMC 26561]